MSDYRLLWGDLHNHNALGYGMGSLARSYDIARSHLDFYAFTPHGQHADGGRPDGYDSVNSRWEDIQRAAADENRPGEFTTFPGYEWHSSAWGHVHVLSMEDHQPLRFAPDLASLQDTYRGRRALLVPHHIGYQNGVDWELLDLDLSPVIEIFSEHGCSERDTGPFPMLGHSGGPAGGRFTAQHGLSIGKRFGFIAGTDNHDGYPGGYGLGLTGVWAKENSREAIWEGLARRRTVAVTGDRISVDLSAGDHPSGSAVGLEEERTLRYEVTGWDGLKQVEVVRNGVPVSVQSPDHQRVVPAGEVPFRLRVEYGWGPMKGYQVFDWEGSLEVDGGELSQAVPCFASDPFDEVRRKRIVEQTPSGCRWVSHTSRGGALTTRNANSSCRSTDALCVEVIGTLGTRVRLSLRCETRESLLATPSDWSIANASSSQNAETTIGELFGSSVGFGMRPCPAWAVVHRAVPPSLYSMSGEYEQADGGDAYYYVRATQENGQMAWSSPVWIVA